MKTLILERELTHIENATLNFIPNSRNKAILVEAIVMSNEKSVSWYFKGNIQMLETFVLLAVDNSSRDLYFPKKKSGIKRTVYTETITDVVSIGNNFIEREPITGSLYKDWLAFVTDRYTQIDRRKLFPNGIGVKGKDPMFLLLRCEKKKSEKIEDLPIDAMMDKILIKSRELNRTRKQAMSLYTTGHYNTMEE